MTKKLKISVVLCSCDGEAYLSEQLLTLLTQSRLPDEIVIGDDASTDRTWAIVEAFVVQARARGLFTQAIRRPVRVGYVTNFSQSLSMASGDLVFLCDQDDAWHPDKVAVMEARFLAEPRLTLLHSDARLVSSRGDDLGYSLFEALELEEEERVRVRTGTAFDVYLRRNIATGATTAFRRELLAMALPIPTSWVHDAWLAAIAAANGTVGLIDDALIDYRQHAHNLIGMRRRTWVNRYSEFRLPRNEELHMEAGRLQSLRDRLVSVRGTDGAVDKLQERHAHVSRRISLGDKAFLLRIPFILREWATGSYGRFATGFRTALRDLVRKG